MIDTETTTQPTAAELLALLISDRQRLAELQAEMDAKRLEFAQSVAGLATQINDAQTLVAITESDVRRRAVDEYERTGSKAPLPGVVVKEFKRIEYDDADALSWAIRHNLALTFDRKAFEKLAKSGAVTGPVVRERVEPQAQIAATERLVEALKGASE